MVQPACEAVPEQTVSMAYQAWLGFYNSNLKHLGWNQSTLVERANDWAVGCVFQREPPSLQAKTVGKMGLKGVPGLRVEGRNGVPARPQSGKGGNGKGGKGGQGKGF